MQTTEIHYEVRVKKSIRKKFFSINEKKFYFQYYLKKDKCILKLTSQQLDKLSMKNIESKIESNNVTYFLYKNIIDLKKDLYFVRIVTKIETTKFDKSFKLK